MDEPRQTMESQTMESQTMESQTMESQRKISVQNDNDVSPTPGVAVAEENATQVATRPQEKRDTKRKRQPKYNVLLWDDDQHSYEYVIDMMQKVFGHSTGKGLRIAFEVDKQGVAVCLTTTMEHAELKCQQIRSFGRDALIATSVGSMKSTIEPVEAAG